MLTDEQKKEMLLELSDLCDNQQATYDTASLLIDRCIDKLSEMNSRLKEAAAARRVTDVNLKLRADGEKNAALAEVGMDMYHLDKTLELFTRYTEGCKAQLESLKALNDTDNKKMGDLLDELTNP